MNRKTNVFIKVAIFAFVIFAVISVVELQFKYNDYKLQRDVLKAEVEALEEEKNALEDQLNTPIDEEYIISVAKEKLSLRLPEEIIFYNDLYK